MSRLPIRMLTLFAALWAAQSAVANDPPPAPSRPALASDAEAAEALATFREEFKARGLRGEDELSQKDWAMSRLASVQHASVVDALAKASRDRHETVRTLAVIYLGEQRALPALAGDAVVKAMERNDKNTVLIMSGLQSLGSLKYLGARSVIEKLIAHQDFAIRKAAISAVGSIGDMRMLDRILKLVGIDFKGIQSQASGAGAEGSGSGTSDGSSSGGSEVVSEGYSWEGAEAVVDYGHADNTQENAEAKAKAEAQIAQNKAEAEARANQGSGLGGPTGGSPASGAGGSGSAGATTARGGTARTPQELMPAILRTLWQLTGEKFSGPGQVRRFLLQNARHIADIQGRLDLLEKEQRQAR
jgi:hypothetical protein